jgi:hypothetical protein
MTSAINYKTNQEDINDDPYLSYLVQPNLHGKPQRLPSLKVLWIRIFYYSGPTEKETMSLRCLCKLFAKALKQRCWTSFPHPNYQTLQSLVTHLEELQGDESSSGNVPSVIFIDEGEFGSAYRYDTITIQKPLSIIGAGREKTVLFGIGLVIRGNKINGIVEIHDLKIKEGDDGLSACQGMNVIMRGCTIDSISENGVYASGADITCDDLQVIESGGSGVYADDNAAITLSGHGTSIQGNGCWCGQGYGLKAGINGKILLVHPLTKEKISTNNDEGRNWDKHWLDGTIEQISK